MEKFTETNRYNQAKKKVDNIRAFYIHFICYIVFNTTITTIKIFDDLDEGKTFQDALFDFGTIAIWLIWGIGILVHMCSVFGVDYFLGKNWEAKRLKKYMDEEERFFYDN